MSNEPNDNNAEMPTYSGETGEAGETFIAKSGPLDDQSAEPIAQRQPEDTSKDYDVQAQTNSRFAFDEKTRSYSLKRNSEGANVWLSTGIEVYADSRTADSKQWSRVVCVTDPDGVSHTHQIPRRLFTTDGGRVIGDLLESGATITPIRSRQNLLLELLQTFPAYRRLQSVGRTGWHETAGKEPVYVLPETKIGEDSESIVLQGGQRHSHFGSSGSLEEWRQEVSSRCIGNSRLVMAACIAFAGPMVKLTGDESGGFHYVGRSSTGKTTAARVAASIWGPPEFMRNWRTTDNALEIVACHHSDAILILDEMSQCDPKKAGEIAYTLANGKSKARMTRDITVREVAEWRLLFLSTGEVSLSTHMEEGGKKTRAGQEARIAEIPADANCGYGLFEHLHGESGGDAFSKTMSAITRLFYGTPGLRFVAHLIDIKNDWPSLKKTVSTITKVILPKSADGQATRVAGRFALAAVAGEMATRAGITGWPEAEAIRAAQKCFDDWVIQRGGLVNRERTEALKAVRLFIEQHGSSRFQSLDKPDDERSARASDEWGDLESATDKELPERPIYNRAGFSKELEDGRYYYVFKNSMREILKGLEYNDALKCLREAGVLVPDSGGKLTRSERLPGFPKIRVHVISPKIMDEDITADDEKSGLQEDFDIKDDDAF